jgi:hypothetical protein
MYACRADSENRIKELKEDLSLDTFCLKSFDATDAAFRVGGVLYNLLADFREALLPRSWFEKRLRAVRDFVFLVGADLINQRRRADSVCHARARSTGVLAPLADLVRGITDCGAVGMESIRPNSHPSRQNRFSNPAVTSSFYRQSVALNLLLRNPGLSNA